MLNKIMMIVIQIIVMAMTAVKLIIIVMIMAVQTSLVVTFGDTVDV